MKRVLHLLRPLLPVLLTLIGTCAWAQRGAEPSAALVEGYDLNHYQGLQSVGTLPQDFKKSLGELYGEDRQRVRNYADGKLKNADKVLQSSYYINELMTSGRVVYGDPISRMVERVADTLLHDYPDLRRELRFYTVKSSAVNAFSTGQGIVFVNAGLVAQLQDEAQLAYILSHEIVHYLKKHTWEQMVITDNKSSRSVQQDVDNFLRVHNRSRQMESQADSLGLMLFFLPSAYGAEAVAGVFDVLQYSYLPFDEVPLEASFFNTPYYKLPGNCLMEQVDPITATDDYDDSKSSHPNLLKRRNMTASLIAQSGHEGGQHYVVSSPEEFARLRTLARFECIRQDMIANDFPRAFYNSYVMQRQMPDNLYLQEALAHSLYAVSRYRTENTSDDLVESYKSQEGEMQQSYYLFHKASGDDLAILALRQVWKAHQLDPANPRLKDMASMLAVDLRKNYHLSPQVFSATFDTAAAAADTAAATSANSKYDRIKAKRHIQDVQNTRCYAFTDLMQADATFRPFLLQAQMPDTSFAGVQSVLICNPSYYCIHGKKEEMRVKASDAKRATLVPLLTALLAHSGMTSRECSEDQLPAMTTAAEYNEFVTLSDWCNEFMASPGDYVRSFSTQGDIAPILSKYHSNVVNITNVVSVNRMNGSNGVGNAIYTAFFAVVALPFMPEIIYSSFAHSYYTWVGSYFVDAATGRLLAKEVSQVSMKDSRSVLNSMLYRGSDKLRHVK